jgi:hypothetical protein
MFHIKPRWGVKLIFEVETTLLLSCETLHPFLLCMLQNEL